MRDYTDSNSSTQSPSLTLRRKHLVALFAPGLIVPFFLPWVHGIVRLAVGLQFLFGGRQAIFLWACVTALIALVMAFSCHSATKVLTVLAGLIPFRILGYVLIQGEDGSEALDTGAWTGFVPGLVPIVLGAHPPPPGPMFMKFTTVRKRLK